MPEPPVVVPHHRQVSIQKQLYFEWHEANSIEANARLKNFAEGLGKALKALELMRPAERLGLVYDGGTAMAIFFDRVGSGDSKSDELQGSLPDVLAGLKARALDKLATLRSNGGRPPEMHNYMLCWELATIFQDADGEASIDGAGTSPFARFLTVIHEYLPENIRPEKETFLDAARRALGYKDKSDWEKSFHPGSIWKRRRARHAQARECDERKAAPGCSKVHKY